MRLQDVHDANGVCGEEGEGDQADAEKEHHPMELLGIVAGKAKEETASHTHDTWEKEIESLDLGIAIAPFPGQPVGEAVGSPPGHDEGGDGGHDDGEQAEAQMVERPAPRRSQQLGGDGVAGREGGGDDGRVEHGDEEQLRMEEGAKTVPQGREPFAPVGMSLVQLKVALPCTGGIAVMVDVWTDLTGSERGCGNSPWKKKERRGGLVFHYPNMAPPRVLRRCRSELTVLVI